MDTVHSLKQQQGQFLLYAIFSLCDLWQWLVSAYVHDHVLLPVDSCLIETNEFPQRTMLYF